MRKVLVCHIINWLSFILILLLTACEREILWSESGGGEEQSEDKVKIEIFTRSNSYALPSTRALEFENEVGKTPWVLVFKGSGGNAKFLEAVQAFELLDKRYVILSRQPADSKYQLLVLANLLNNKFCYGDENTEYEFNKSNLLKKLAVGSTTLSTACSELLTGLLPTPSFDGALFTDANATIPMSSVLELDKIDDDTKIENSDGSPLLLTRAVAKLVVANKAPNFTLKGIAAVVNAPRQGELHNFDDTIMDSSSSLTEYRHDDSYTDLLAKASAADIGQSTATNPVYLHESNKLNETYVIIQGAYGGQDYYYKMAIVNGSFQQMNLLRNYFYTFIISAVKGPGYNSVEDAKISKASNMDLSYRIVINETDSYEIIANNDYYLGVSNSVFITYFTDNVMQVYEAFSVITNCQEEYVNAKTITDNKGDVEGSFEVEYPSEIPIVSGSTSNPRISPVGVRVGGWLQWHEDTQYGGDGQLRKNAYVTLKLGNLEKKVFIRQRSGIPVEGTTLRYGLTYNTNPTVNEVNYYCLSGYVDSVTNPDAKNWIKLRPSTSGNRDDTESIMVDDGIIHIEIQANGSGASRTGIVYLTTIGVPGSSSTANSMERIKISITQLGA